VIALLGREDIWSSRPRGLTLIEIIFVIALWAVIAGIAVPQVLVALHRQKAWAAARYLAARMAMARSYAVTRSAYVALRFTRLGDDVMFQMFVDGNRNGVRTLDIGSHVDLAIDVSARLSELFPGVVIGVSSDVGTDPVRLGSTNLLSFSPLGTATPGTIYVRSREGLQLAVRITGATGRTRLLRYVPRTREWVGSF
jgi:prepilin-type N-terminal cleavage/methylation domain-containing protein